MKSKTKTRKPTARGMTRREFVGTTALAAAGVMTGAPAILRGQNLNNKLDIAFIAAGGRALASLSELTITPGRPPSQQRGLRLGASGAASRRERCRALRRERRRTRCRVRAVPEGEAIQRSSKSVRRPERVRRRGGGDGRAARTRLRPTWRSRTASTSIARSR